LLGPGDQPEQGGFAGPVRAHEAGFLAGINLETRAGEQNLPAVLLDDIRKNNHGILLSFDAWKESQALAAEITLNDADHQHYSA
jgi:hypothetical protein